MQDNYNDRSEGGMMILSSNESNPFEGLYVGG
jgi:hypothetical protein